MLHVPVRRLCGFCTSKMPRKRITLISLLVALAFTAIVLYGYSCTRAAQGLLTRNRQHISAPFVYQLLPHLMDDPHSLKPAYHMKGTRSFADVVLGVPTVKRDKESYLSVTLSHLVNGLGAHINNTLIIVYVGDTDIQFVLKIASQIEYILYLRQMTLPDSDPPSTA